jgi:hypothetical protein
MKKNYIVRLTKQERQVLLSVINKLKDRSQKVRRAPILIKADVDGPNWHDQQIADAFMCSRQSVEGVRKRFVTEGFELTLNGPKRETPPRAKILNGDQEATIIALRLSDPPKGRNGWTLRLLAEKVVELEIASSVSHVTLHKMLKKTKYLVENCNTG